MSWPWLQSMVTPCLTCEPCRPDKDSSCGERRRNSRQRSRRPTLPRPLQLHSGRLRMTRGTSNEELEQDEEHGYSSLSSGWSENHPFASWRHVAYIALCTATISSLVGTAVGFKVKDDSGAHSSNVEVAFTEDRPTCSMPLSPVYAEEPLAKHIVRKFDQYLMMQAAFATSEQKFEAVSQWLAPEFEYQTVGFPTTHGLKDWVFGGEESEFRRAFHPSVFSQMLFFGDTGHATTTSYGNVRWVADLFGIPAQNAWVYFRVLDFYSLRHIGPGRGLLNWKCG
ncbi:styx-b [Symbiodinium sp. CCMP2592]|nr:styx-b [Symbiodinium sp. CCMP2592]